MSRASWPVDMKFHQEFDVAGEIADLWGFFDQPVRVAECIPGVEQVDQIDADTLLVRITQKIGPLGATFESKVHIVGRIPLQRIEFVSSGKAVRGAIGNFRATNAVSLESHGGGTRVRVGGDLVLAGALGSVGQKLVLKHAEKVTLAFAANLERALSAPPEDAAAVERMLESSPPGNRPPPAARAPGDGPGPGGPGPGELLGAVRRAEKWARLSVAVSGATLLIGLMILRHLGNS